MPGSLLTESRGSFVLVTINRPEKLNAMSNDLISGLMYGIKLDRSVRAMVITGAGHAFSAGADISEFQPHMKEGPSEAVARFIRMTRRVKSFPKPVIAAVNVSRSVPDASWSRRRISRSVRSELTRATRESR